MAHYQPRKSTTIDIRHITIWLMLTLIAINT